MKIFKGKVNDFAKLIIAKIIFLDINIIPFCGGWRILLLCFGFITFTSNYSAAQTTAGRQLNFIVEPYLQQLNDTSFKVLWETSVPARGFVRLGVAEFNVLKPDLTQMFYMDNSSEFPNVLVNGLKPGEKYFYQAFAVAETGDTLFGSVTPLNIPDYSKMPVSFAVIGDTQNSPDIWGKLSNWISREIPSFIVHVGDLVQNGYNKEDWVDEFFKPAKELLRFYPLYPVLGNHEGNHPFFYQYFDLPSPEWFYTIKKGDVLFIFADTNKDILPGSAQYRKFEKILASATETWKIVVHHHPVYVSEQGFYGNTWFQNSVHGDPNEMHLKKLYDTYGVDLVLNGHAHFYERTWPLFNDRVDPEKGVVYITTGGGNDEYSKFAANKSWYDARTRVINHFLSINIVDQTMYGSAIDTAGNVFDTFTIQKKNNRTTLNAPYFSDSKMYFYDNVNVSIQNLNGAGELYYSTDSETFLSSGSAKIDLPIDNTTTITAYVKDGNVQSRIATRTFEKLPLFLSGKKARKKITADYYEGNWIALPDFENLEPLKSFTPDSVSLEQIQPRAKDHFAVRFTGSFLVPETGIYRIYLESFDGSRILIDGERIIDNDGIHYEIKRENFIALEKGTHHFEIQYFDYVRRETLVVLMGLENGSCSNFNNFLHNE
jgi:hypothetical protein